MREKFYACIFMQVPTDSTEQERAEQWQEVRTRAKHEENFFKVLDEDGMWDVRIEGRLFPNDNYVGGPGRYAVSEINAMIQSGEIDMQGFEYEFHQLWARVVWYGDGPSGYGLFYQPLSWVAANYGVNINAHEFLHNWKLRHADSKRGDRIVSYGDSTCVMGGARSVLSLCAPKRVQLGFDSDQEVVYPTESGQYVLCPVELRARDMFADEAQIIVIRRAGHPDYYLSIRKTIGTPLALWGQNPEQLYIHYVDNEGHSVLLDDHVLLDDSEYTLPNGVTVHYEEYDPDKERATIYVEFPEE
jgi:hypothetical protein